MPIKKVTKSLGESSAVLEEFKKSHGEHVVRRGAKLRDVQRLATGVFPFDLASGGGLPYGRVCIIYGPESSGKTYLALRAIASAQRRGETACYIDLESTHDVKWAGQLGVDNASLLLATPDNAEQAVDIIEAMMYAKDVGVVVVDSVAQLNTDKAIQRDGGQVIPGGSSVITTQLIAKVTTALGQESKRGHYPVLVLLNQIRYKIGVMFGDPETYPGGNSQRFASSLTVRLYGKKVKDDAAHKTLPARLEVAGVIRKWKVPITGTNFEYDVSLVPYRKLKVGEVESWGTVSTRLQAAGELHKVPSGKGWICMGTQFATLAEIEEQYRADEKYREKLQSHVVQLANKIETEE